MLDNLLNCIIAVVISVQVTALCVLGVGSCKAYSTQIAEQKAAEFGEVLLKGKFRLAQCGSGGCKDTGWIPCSIEDIDNNRYAIECKVNIWSKTGGCRFAKTK